MTIQEWLNKEPLAEEISFNDDGSQYLPIAIVEEKLSRLTDGLWSTTSFTYKIQEFGESLIILASIELTVTYNSITRTLIGCTTFSDKTYGINQDWLATAKSECIKNASKALGLQFGSGLNNRLDKKVIQQKTSDDIKTDRIVKLINNCKSIEELATYKESAPMKEYMAKLKELTNK